MMKFVFALAFISSAAFAEVDMETCKKTFSSEPYCVSHGNSERACALVDGSEQTLTTMTNCLRQFSEMYGGMSPELQMLCLAGHVLTGDAGQDASNCVK